LFLNIELAVKYNEIQDKYHPYFHDTREFCVLQNEWKHTQSMIKKITIHN
jgi:hypothetical protein